MKKIFVFAFLLFEISFTLSDISLAQIVVRTSGMISNNEAYNGMKDLLRLLDNAGIIIVPLEDVLNSSVFHQEGADAGGLTLANGDFGVTFRPARRGPVGLTLYNNTLVIIDDSFTHIIFNKDTINDLRDRKFSEASGLLRDTADTAIHELLHAMIFRTRCFQGSRETEEGLVANDLTPDIKTTLTIYFTVQNGNITAAQRLYDILVTRASDSLQKKWTCDLPMNQAFSRRHVS